MVEHRNPLLQRNHFEFLLNIIDLSSKFFLIQEAPVFGLKGYLDHPVIHDDCQAARVNYTVLYLRHVQQIRNVEKGIIWFHCM